MLDAKEIIGEFDRLHAAIRADAYRVTVQYSPKDPTIKFRGGHGLGPVINPRSKDYSSPPLAVDAILAAVPALIAFSQRENLVWQGIPVRANIFLTPLSHDRHHPIIDDVWSEEKCDQHPDPAEAKAKRWKRGEFDDLIRIGDMVGRIFCFAAEIESSPGNFQYVFNIRRRPAMMLADIFKDKTITDEAANQIVAVFNDSMGDVRVNKVQQAFRFPGFINRKAQYIDAGIIHAARLHHVEPVFCLLMEENIEKASIEIEAEQLERVNVDEGTSRATSYLYAAHQADILRHNPDLHYSKYDIMIAARLYVTGHDTDSIADAILAGTPRRHGHERSYARDTAANADKEITTDMLAKRDLWRIIESGDPYYHNEDPGLPRLLAWHEAAEQRAGARGDDAVELAALAMFYVGHSRACIERSIEAHRPDLDAVRIARDVSSTQNGFWRSIIKKTLPRWTKAEEEFQQAALRRPKMPKVKRPPADHT